METRLVSLNPLLIGRDTVMRLPSQIRVNIVYERNRGSTSDVLVNRRRALTPPPKLELEGYENEAPNWAGEEVVVSEEAASFSGNNSCDAIEEPSTSSQFDDQHNDFSFLYHTAPKRPRVSLSNVLRFSSIEEMEAYCAENKLDAASTSRDWMLPSDQQEALDSPPLIYAIDPDYGCTTTACQQRSLSRTLVIDDDEEPPKVVKGILVECRLCNVKVTKQRRKEHIYQFHLKKPLYKCPLCSISSIYHRTNMNQHIRKRHRSMLNPIVLKDLYVGEVDAWLYSCFGDRRMFRFIDPDVVSVAFDLLEWTSTGRTVSPQADPALISLRGHRGDVDQIGFDPQQMPEDLLEPDACEPVAPPVHQRREETMPPKPKSNVTTCNICGMVNVKHLERHVLQHHVKRPMYLCPFCHYSSNYAVSSVKDHIKVKHSLTEQGEPIDLRDENWSSIRRIYDVCFPLPDNISYPISKTGEGFIKNGSLPSY